MGKYLFSSGNIGLWEEIRPYGLPVVLGFLWKIGLSSILWYRLLAVLFAAGAVYLVFRIGDELVGETFGLFSAVLLAFSPLFFSSAPDIMTDLPSVFFSLAAVYFFLKGNMHVSGLFAFLAFFFRFPHFMVAVSIVIACFFTKDALGRASRFLLPFVFLMGVFFAVNFWAYGDMAKPLFSAASHQGNEVYAVDGVWDNFAYYFLKVPLQNIFLIFFLPGMVFSLRDRRFFVLSIAAFFYILYFTVIINKQERFLLSFLPFLVILSAFWAWHSYKLIKMKLKLSFVVFAVCLGFVLAVGFLGAYWKIEGHYKWLLDEEPEVQGVYAFFSSVNGTVLTSDPVFSAYSDTAKFLHYYSNPYDSFGEYEASKGRADYVVYTPDFYPCGEFGPDCELKKHMLFERINAENVLVLDRTVEGRRFYIFERKTI
ncbi:glycosyltransferase family 39 protein [Candidatus Woesearchaeota archaeon]|nr:glycosyltransferase family 39 protein [Candidatus Woesearchaeota archaeon]